MKYREIKELKKERSVMFLTRPVSVKADPQIVEMLNAESVESGFNVCIPDDSFIRICSDGTFLVEWENNNTQWEYCPHDGMTRHCGVADGAFWTDWE